MEYQNGQPLLGHAPAGAHGPNPKRISRPQGTVPDDLGPAAPHHFLGASERVRPSPAMTAYAREHLAEGATTLAVVEALGGALHRDLRFDAGATTIETDPEEAFEARHGVCQDFSHIMIARLRGIGIPAGYVSGYLRTRPPKGRPRLA
ncbi:transglutaminase family protein, partial [Hoeflea sp.]|uniref:transglutaminase-like domain-containing protein n=1 Tax=Hoeflea sp. TaxID=1940281 RepID=UPI0019B85D5F